MKNCCDECQMIISDAFDSSQEECTKLLSQWQSHIDQCEQCAQFFNMWNPAESPLSAIAKRSYTAQLSPQRLNSVMDEVHTEEPAQPKNIVQMFIRPVALTLGAAAAIIFSVHLFTQQATTSPDPIITGSTASAPAVEADTPQPTAIAIKPLSEQITEEKIRKGYGVIDKYGALAWNSATDDLTTLKNYIKQKGSRLKSRLD